MEMSSGSSRANRSALMNKEQAEGKWNTLKGRLKQTYGDAFNDLDKKNEGSFDEIKGRLQTEYGKTKEEAHKILEEMMDGDK